MKINNFEKIKSFNAFNNCQANNPLRTCKTEIEWRTVQNINENQARTKIKKGNQMKTRDKAFGR